MRDYQNPNLKPDLKINDPIQTKFGPAYITEVYFSEKKGYWMVAFTILENGKFKDKWEYADSVRKL